MTNLSAGQLRRAADIKDKIESLQGELGRLLGSTGGKAAPGKRRQLSAAARARIAAAQKKRWARQRGGKARSSSSKSTTKPRRKFSAAARKRLSQLAKARWTKAKASGKKSL